MLMDFELHTKVNEIIADLTQELYTALNIPLDMVVTQDDKYRNTEYETITIGLGTSQGMRKDKYYFNAIQDDNNEFAERYYNEPVSFYENNDSHCLVYKLVVDTMARVITVYNIQYIYAGGDKHMPTYEKLKTLKLGKSKFSRKVVHTP